MVPSSIDSVTCYWIQWCRGKTDSTQVLNLFESANKLNKGSTCTKKWTSRERNQQAP